jgi:hypothetical protein
MHLSVFDVYRVIYITIASFLGWGYLFDINIFVNYSKVIVSVFKLLA